jgi:hypothetical protein
MKRESTNLTIQCSVQLCVDFERCDDHHGDGSPPQAGAPGRGPTHGHGREVARKLVAGLVDTLE